MGFFGSLGRALTAPIRATNKVVGKAPGMGGVMGAVGQLPGMGGQKPGGIGQKSKLGIGPTTPPPPQQSMAVDQNAQKMPELPAGQGGDTMGGGTGTPSPFQTMSGKLGAIFGGMRGGAQTQGGGISDPRWSNGTWGTRPPMQEGPSNPMQSLQGAGGMGAGIGPSQPPAGMMPNGPVPQQRRPFGPQY